MSTGTLVFEKVHAVLFDRKQLVKDLIELFAGAGA